MIRIALLVETSLASGRQILSGVARFVQEHNDVSIFYHSGQLGEMNPASLVDWHGDGIIARVLNPAIAATLTKTGLPVIDVLGNVEGLTFPLVKCNNREIGKMVAEAFGQNGFRHFGMIGLSRTIWSAEREAAYHEVAQQYKGSHHNLHISPEGNVRATISTTMDALRQWLPDLPKPIGIFVASDQFAPLLFEVAQEFNIRIPEDISVIGVDNDEPYCELCRPALSSVIPNHEQVGYTAAQMLLDTIKSRPPAASMVEISPRMIQLRRSSSSLAVDDPQLASALERIRTHACSGISIDEIANHCGLSRSVLIRRFRSNLNRTVGESILNEKLNRAKQLLYTSNFSMNQIAEQSGFNCQEYMNHVFKKHLGHSPRHFRKHSIKS